MSYDNKPLITVCIPSHRPHLRHEAEHSVRVARDYYEAGGGRGCVQILVSESHCAWPTKLQDMLYMAAGQYVMVLPDDDKLADSALAFTMAAAENAKADIVYGAQQSFGEKSIRLDGLPWSLASFKDTNPVRGWTALVRTALIRSIGGLDTRQQWQDYDLFYRCYKVSPKVVVLPFVTHDYRWHADMGSKHMDHQAARKLLIEKHPELA